MSDPVAVTVSRRGEFYVANAGSGIVMVFDSSGRLLRRQDCRCSISGMAPLRDSVFRLTDRIDLPIILLDANTPEDRIFFIPAQPKQPMQPLQPLQP